MDLLPSEIILYLITFLEPKEIAALQLISRRFFNIARDPTVWRDQCFQSSGFLSRLRRRAELIQGAPVEDPRFHDLQRVLAAGNGLEGSRNAHGQADDGASQDAEQTPTVKTRAAEKVRIMANWDPSYPTERVDWQTEYIQRCAPISLSWMQQPRNRDSVQREYLEVRGLGLYNDETDDSTLAVAPLDDGSVCIWDVNGSRGKKGAIIGRSHAEILADGPGLFDATKRDKMVSTGVTECVSVDGWAKRAYIAVQSSIVEIDLETLKPISSERFPFSISALSEARSPTPMTVATSLSMHLYDSRTHNLHTSSTSSTPSSPTTNLSYSPLFQPGPLAITHLPSPDAPIYLAGRFPSILHYDRRKFSHPQSTIHSGGRLCGLTSLPHPFVSTSKDLMRRGELSVEQVQAAKSKIGNTLVACGEYNSKGSLEIYGLNDTSSESSDGASGGVTDASRNSANAMKNRQTSSSSKLLSVSAHGTRLVFSDGGGNIKWVERDGVTEVRRWNVNHGTSVSPLGIFGRLGEQYVDEMLGRGGDIVRKIVNTGNGSNGREMVNGDDLVVWTGEKLGVLGLGKEEMAGTWLFKEEEEEMLSEEERRRVDREKVYGETMRRALVIQADEVRFMRGLGLGGS